MPRSRCPQHLPRLLPNLARLPQEEACAAVLARLRLHRVRVRRSTSLLSLKSGSHMGVHMPPAGVVPPRVAHGRIGVGWVPQKQASVTQCSVFSIALGATRMPSGHVCTPCTDALWPHADRPTPYVRPARSARRAMAALWPHARAFGPPVVSCCAD